jgi:SP family sugar:H+ symporter-like MFS transporter
MFIMSIWALCTATIVTTSQGRDQILVGRILNYCYIGMELSVVPVYQSEIVPARFRGAVVATFQLSLATGAFIINCVCRGTSNIASNASFRIPYGLMYIVPTFVASATWFIPESPRWLLRKDQPDDALVSLKKFNADQDDAAVKQELSVLQ